MAGFGQVAAALERTTYADRRRAGVAHVVLLVGGAVATGIVAERARGPHDLYVALTRATRRLAVVHTADLPDGMEALEPA